MIMRCHLLRRGETAKWAAAKLHSNAALCSTCSVEKVYDASMWLIGVVAFKPTTHANNQPSDSAGDSSVISVIVFQFQL